MNIAEIYSHLNGYEFMLVRKPALWKEIESVVEMIDVEACRTKASKERGMVGKLLYSPIDLNRAFKTHLQARGWRENRVKYWVTKNERLIRRTMTLPADEQKYVIESSGEQAIFSYNQTDFTKDRVAIEVQLGKCAFVAYDLFVKHMAFYIGDEIDVGVEILPMKSMQSQMSSGVAYYEGELYNVVRQGRGIPAVPLVLIGVSP